MRALAALLFVLLLWPLSAMAADTRLADPKPSWDNPRKIVLQLNSDEPRHANNVLYNAVNLQKFYGQDNVKVVIVAYAGGVRALLSGSSPVADRVASLQSYDVEFLACGNTLDTIGRKAADLLPGVGVVTAGIAEIVERQLQGWQTVAP